MQDQEVLEQLEALVLHLGLELRWEEGEFTGGICRLRGQEIFLVNRSLPTLEKIRVLCRELSQADLSRAFVLPALRERIIQFDLETDEFKEESPDRRPSGQYPT